MKLSDRDTKLIILILIALIIVVPYLLVIKPYNEKIETATTTIKNLTERSIYLSQLDVNRTAYLNDIDLLNAKRDELIKDFATGVRQENSLMFIRNAEIDFIKKDKDIHTYPFISNIDFTDVVRTPISQDEYNEDGTVKEKGLTAENMSMTVDYVCKYDDIKALVEYLINNKEKMTLSAFSLQNSNEKGYVEGVFVLNQYAITGEGRELPAAEIPQMNHGNSDPFDENDVIAAIRKGEDVSAEPEDGGRDNDGDDDED